MAVKTGYKQTEVGVIPEEWEVVALDQRISLYSGQHILAKEYNSKEDGIPYLTGPTDFPDGELKVSKWTYHPKVEAKKNDILITAKGSGAGKVFSLKIQKAAISRQLMAIRSNGIFQQYLFFFLQKEEKYLAQRALGNLIPGLSRKDVLSLKLLLPPVEEQTAIATALSDADALITALDRLIAKKRAIKQGAMQELLTGKKRLPGFEGEWEVKRLGDLGTFSKGKGIKKDEVVDDGLPCVRYGEIYTHHNDFIREFYSFIPENIAKNTQQIKTGDLLFAGSGETAEEIGKCVANLNDGKAYAGGDIIIFSPIMQDSKYLSYLMNHPRISTQKARMGQGDAVVHISAKNLAKLTFSLPSLPEQTAIASVLSDMDAEIAALEQKRDKALMIKEGMMQELLTGRTRLI